MGATRLLQVRSSVAKHAVPFQQDKTGSAKLQHEKNLGEQAPIRELQPGIHENVTIALHHSGVASQETKAGVPSLLESFLLYRRSVTRFFNLWNLGAIALISLATCLVLLLGYRYFTARPRDLYFVGRQQTSYGGNDPKGSGFLGTGGGYNRRERQQDCC